jgi:hypothetical protein
MLLLLLVAQLSRLLLSVGLSGLADASVWLQMDDDEPWAGVLGNSSTFGLLQLLAATAAPWQSPDSPAVTLARWRGDAQEGARGHSGGAKPNIIWWRSKSQQARHQQLPGRRAVLHHGDTHSLATAVCWC